MSKKTMLVVVMLVLLSMLAAQCGQPPQTVEKVVTEEVEKVVTEEAEAVTEGGEWYEGKVTLDTGIGTEPPSLDPSLATDTTSHWLIKQMFIGLAEFDQEGNVVPQLATSWDVSEDGTVYTFHLRDDVKWVKLDPATGDFTEVGPVTAQDVAYGTVRTLDPKAASDYAFVLYIIKGGEEFNTADVADEAAYNAAKEGVGIKALDDYTVEVTLKEPAGYFPSLAAMWVMYPEPQAAVDEYGEKWTEPGNIVTNGPYTLQEWSHESYLRLVKNPLWVDADSVQIEVIQGPVIQEASTLQSMYEANEIDLMGDPGWDVPQVDRDRIKADSELSKELFIAPRLCTYLYGFVNTKPPFDDVNMRKAFSMAVDRQSLIDNVVKGEQVPAHSFSPPGVFGNVADDMSVAGWILEGTYAERVAKAQEMVAAAGYPEGEGLDLVLMHNTSEDHAQIAQAIQAMWAEVFPKAKITIENQEWKVYLKTLLPEAPDDQKPNIYRIGWCADYPDANNWLNEVYNSKSDQNYAKWNNPEFDKLVEEAARESDPAKRKELYKQAEILFIDENSAIIPIYYYTYVRMYKPWVTKYVINPVGGDPVAQWTMDWEAKKAAQGK